MRVIDGKIKKNMKIKLLSNKKEYIIEKVGVFTPKPTDVNELNSGEIGFIITGIKSLSETKVGDTIGDSSNPINNPLQDLNQVNQLFSVDFFLLIVYFKTGWSSKT